jgi:hypothetical protein
VCRNFKTRYNEHTQDISNNRPKMGYIQHILNTGHEYGSMDNTMEVTKHQQKGSHLSTAEKYHTRKTINRNQNPILNGNLCEQNNPIFYVCSR